MGLFVTTTKFWILSYPSLKYNLFYLPSYWSGICVRVFVAQAMQCQTNLNFLPIRIGIVTKHRRDIWCRKIRCNSFLDFFPIILHFYYFIFSYFSLRYLFIIKKINTHYLPMYTNSYFTSNTKLHYYIFKVNSNICFSMKCLVFYQVYTNSFYVYSVVI